MPTKSAAAKALRQNIKARARNRATQNRLRKLAVSIRKALAASDSAKATQLGKELIRELDRAARKKIIHRNTAARKKSRLQRRLAKA